MSKDLPKRLYDTNVILDSPHAIMGRLDDEIVCISRTTLQELDGLKTRHYKAREAIRTIHEFKDQIRVVGEEPEGTNDDIILRDCINAGCEMVSNDIMMNIKAEEKGVKTGKFDITDFTQDDIYENPRKVYFSEEKVCEFFEAEDCYSGVWDIDKDEPYLIGINEKDDEPFAIFSRVKDASCQYRAMPINDFDRHQGFGSTYLAPVTPKDIYQKVAMDSLRHDDMTILTGKAGTGKTLLSLAYMLYAIENLEYNKIITFTNPVKVRDTVDLGAYKGDKTDKVLQQSVGAMFSTKLGDMLAVEMLMKKGYLEIYPISDVRGMEIAEGEILYLPEMQNSSIDIAKLAVQRVAEGAKIIAEGDMDTQVDMSQFEGSNNGLRRYIEVLHGHEGISHIHLPYNYRSEISSLAENM